MLASSDILFSIIMFLLLLLSAASVAPNRTGRTDEPPGDGGFERMWGVIPTHLVSPLEKPVRSSALPDCTVAVIVVKRGSVQLYELGGTDVLVATNDARTTKFRDDLEANLTTMHQRGYERNPLAEPGVHVLLAVDENASPFQYWYVIDALSEINESNGKIVKNISFLLKQEQNGTGGTNHGG